MKDGPIQSMINTEKLHEMRMKGGGPENAKKLADVVYRWSLFLPPRLVRLVSQAEDRVHPVVPEKQSRFSAVLA